MADTSAWKPVADTSAWKPVVEVATEKPGAVSRFISNAAEQANPVSLLSGMGESMLHPLQAIKGYLKQNSDLADKVEAAIKRGDHGQALKHFGDLALQVVPGLGATSDAAGEQIAQGDVAGGMGKSAGAALGVVEASALPSVARGTARAIHATPGIVADVVKHPVARTAARIGADVALPGLGSAIEVGAQIKDLIQQRKAAAVPPEVPAAVEPPPVSVTQPPEIALQPQIPPPEANVPRETIPTPPPAVEGFTPSPGVWEPDYSQMDPAQLKVFNAVRQAEGQPPIIPEEGWKAHRADAPTSESTAGTEIPATPTAAAKRLSPGAADAKALSDKLGQWDFTPKEAQGMNEKGWAKLAFDSGVKLPSAAVRKGAIFNVIKARQGPPRTVGQLIQRFRTIGEDMQQTGKD